MIPAVHRTAIIDLALAEPQLSPRELAVTYTDRLRTLSRNPAFIACSRRKI
jgi:hypothetical protein